MKKAALLLFLLFLASNSFGQSKGVYVGLKMGYLKYTDYEPRFYGGVELDVEFENQIGIHYNLLGGENYFQMPIAPVAGFTLGFIIANSGSDSSDRVGLGIILGVLTAIIPEGISYNIPINEKFKVSPYVSPLQMTFIKNSYSPEGNWYAGGSLGTRFHVHLGNKYRLSPYVEYKMLYSGNIKNALSYGFNISVRMSPK